MLQTLISRNYIINGLLVLLGILSINNYAFAAAAVADATGLVTIFCNVINQITGGVGKVISILIIISMAIGLFLGKITWGLAIAIMVGMGLLFGASSIVDTVSAGAATNTQDNICAPAA